MSALPRGGSVHQAVEHVLQSHAESDDGVFLSRRASPDRCGDFDRCAAFAALSQRNGVSAALIGNRLPRRALRRVQRRRSRATPRLLAELRIREAAKMGFRRCLLPERNLAKVEKVDGIELIGIREVGEALDAVLA